MNFQVFHRRPLDSTEGVRKSILTISESTDLIVRASPHPFKYGKHMPREVLLANFILGLLLIGSSDSVPTKIKLHEAMETALKK